MNKTSGRNKPHMGLCVCAVFVLAAFSLLAAERRMSARMDYQALTERAVSVGLNGSGRKSTPSEEPDEEEQEDGWDGTGAILSIDFEELIARNDDTIGWLHIPALDVSYPVLYYSENNDYYLNRDFDRNYSAAGVIYLECTNDPDLTDLNSLLYGHNMADGTMFGDLHKLGEDQSLLEEEPYVYLYKADGTVNRYRVFSCYRTESGSDTYATIHSDKGYTYYTEMAEEKSIYDIEVSFEDEPPVLTLSTCHGGPGTTRRFAVHAVLDGTHEM